MSVNWSGSWPMGNGRPDRGDPTSLLHSYGVNYVDVTATRGKFRHWGLNHREEHSKELGAVFETPPACGAETVTVPKVPEVNRLETTNLSWFQTGFIERKAINTLTPSSVAVVRVKINRFVHGSARTMSGKVPSISCYSSWHSNPTAS